MLVVSAYPAFRFSIDVYATPAQATRVQQPTYHMQMTAVLKIGSFECLYQVSLGWDRRYLHKDIPWIHTSASSGICITEFLCCEKLRLLDKLLVKLTNFSFLSKMYELESIYEKKISTCTYKKCQGTTIFTLFASFPSKFWMLLLLLLLSRNAKLGVFNPNATLGTATLFSRVPNRYSANLHTKGYPYSRIYLPSLDETSIYGQIL